MQFVDFMNRSGKALTYLEYSYCEKVREAFTQFDTDETFIDFYVKEGFEGVVKLYEHVSSLLYIYIEYTASNAIITGEPAYIERLIYKIAHKNNEAMHLDSDFRPQSREAEFELRMHIKSILDEVQCLDVSLKKAKRILERAKQKNLLSGRACKEFKERHNMRESFCPID